MACLLSFFQQQRLHRERVNAFRPFQIEKPLWIFVGGRVTKTLAKKDACRNQVVLNWYPKIQAMKSRGLTGGDLESFIVSNTPSVAMRMLWGMEMSELANRHIVFQEEDKESYVQSMLEGVEA